MAAKKIPVWDKRMLELMDWCIYKKLVGSEKDFLLKIGFKHSNNKKQILDGKQSFQHEQFLKASNLYNVSMEWFYGYTNYMHRATKKPTAAELLKQALAILK